MDFIRVIRDSWFTWLQIPGEAVLDTIHHEFHVLLYVAAVFMHPKHWILNSFALCFNFFVVFAYLFLLAQTAIRQMDDFITASQTIHMAVLDILALTMLVFMNLHRGNLIDIFQAMSVEFYDYKDDFEIPEMEEEFRKTRRQKLFVLTAVPSYLAMTALCCMLGKTIDEFFGVGSSEEYVNEVYMMTPVPIWYPFKPEGFLMHYLMVFSQALGANTLALAIAGTDALLIFLSQSILLQFKILINRLRKIEQCAYQLHRLNGGDELKAGQMFQSQSFLECYHTCLKKSVEHHHVIIENFMRMQAFILWPAGIAVVFGAFLIAMSLLAIVLGGGKPSILALAAMLIIAEILNMALICSVSEAFKELGESLHGELYDMNWPDTNTEIKRTMMIIVMRSKRPMVLIAGLTPLSWETFSTIMNSAYTYVNLLVASTAGGKK